MRFLNTAFLIVKGEEGVMFKKHGIIERYRIFWLEPDQDVDQCVPSLTMNYCSLRSSCKNTVENF